MADTRISGLTALTAAAVGDQFVIVDISDATMAVTGTNKVITAAQLAASFTLAAFAATTSAELAGVISDETGSGALVFANTPTLVAPLLGTPTSGVLTNCTGLPLASITGLAANVATFLGTSSSANLRAALTDENGTGAALFDAATTPTFTTGIQIGGAAGSRKILVGNGTNFVPSTETYAVPGSSGNVLTSDGTNWTSAAPASGGANTALSNLASVAINTDLLPASTQGLGNASFPFLATFTGNTTQYESVNQSAGLITHTALGSATNIGFNFTTKGAGTIAASTGEGFTINKLTAGVSNSILTLTYQSNPQFTVSTTGVISAYGNVAFQAVASKITWAGNGGFGSNAAGVMEVLANATTGQWGSLLAGVRDTGTTTVVNGLTLDHQANAVTPGVGYGIGILFNNNSSTTDNQNAAQIAAVASDSTHATRTYDLAFSTVLSAAPLAENMRLKASGNLKLAGTALRATTEGTNHVDIFDGTAPAGTLANGCSLYSTAGELRVMDAAGNPTLLSPHDENGYWIFNSRSGLTGKMFTVHMERLIRALNDQLGGGFIEDEV